LFVCKNTVISEKLPKAGSLFSYTGEALHAL
jgi:hypothetical protein